MSIYETHHQAYYTSYSYEDITKDYPEEYSILLGANGFLCVLGETEDRTWERDGRNVVDELNRLYQENQELKEKLANLPVD